MRGASSARLCVHMLHIISVLYCTMHGMVSFEPGPKKGKALYL